MTLLYHHTDVPSEMPLSNQTEKKTYAINLAILQI